MPYILARKLYDILLNRDIEYAEAHGAFLAVLWGFWFVAYSQGKLVVEQPTAIVLQCLAPNLVWGIVFIGVGGLQLVGLRQGSYTLRRCAAMLAVMWWLFVAVYLLLNQWQLLSCPTSFALSVASAWAYLRLRRDPRYPRFPKEQYGRATTGGHFAP